MSKRERYAVGEVVHPDGTTVTVGIAYDPSNTSAQVEELATRAKLFARDALDAWGDDHAGVARYVEVVMDERLRGTPFYAETWNRSGRGVQVYQPYGMPQDGTTPQTSGCRYDSCGICGTDR